MSFLNGKRRPESDRVRVLLAHESRVVRDRFREELKRLPFIELIGEANTSERALALFFQARPAVVVVSVLLPEQSGFDVLRCIKGAVAETTVVLASGSSNPFVQEVAALLGATAVCPVTEQDGALELTGLLQRLFDREGSLRDQRTKRLRDQRTENCLKCRSQGEFGPKH